MTLTSLCQSQVGIYAIPVNHLLHILFMIRPGTVTQRLQRERIQSLKFHLADYYKMLLQQSTGSHEGTQQDLSSNYSQFLIMDLHVICILDYHYLQQNCPWGKQSREIRTVCLKFQFAIQSFLQQIHMKHVLDAKHCLSVVIRQTTKQNSCSHGSQFIRQMQ